MPRIEAAGRPMTVAKLLSKDEARQFNEDGDFAFGWMSAVQVEEHIAYWVGTSCPFRARCPCIVEML
jgi:hypothetical protein